MNQGTWIRAALCCALVAGCTNGLGSGRGESCRARNDCENGLLCIHNVCTVEDFAVEVSARSCDAVECLATADCCFGDPCNMACQNEQCVETCVTGADCASGMCSGMRCVECLTNADCFGGTCVTGQCEFVAAGCRSTRECPALNVCQEGECVYVGCQDDHECIALTRNLASTCVDAQCVTPCEFDADCNPGGFFDFQACIEGNCTFIGCITNEECRIRLGQLAVCRE
jgi:hypothetical protein